MSDMITKRGSFLWVQQNIDSNVIAAARGGQNSFSFAFNKMSGETDGERAPAPGFALYVLYRAGIVNGAGWEGRNRKRRAGSKCDDCGVGLVLTQRSQR